MKDKEKQAGWWGISVGICILKSCGVKRTKLKKSLMDIVDYLYLDKEMEK